MGFFAYHDSHSIDYRKPFGAVICGEKIRFRLELGSTVRVEACFLRLWERDRERLIPMEQKTGESQVRSVGQEISIGAIAFGRSTLKTAEPKVVFEVEYDAPNAPGLVWYYFRIQVAGEQYFYGNNKEKLGGEGSLELEEPPSYQVTVHSPMEIPRWYKQGIMYQIFVDRFYHAHEDGFVQYPRKNALLHANWYDTPFYIKDKQGRVTNWGFYGGNLLGVIKKLPYLYELGISIIYFNPIFDAPSNHKYDTADYHTIDPMFGDEAIFEQLIKAAKSYGIAIVLDGVFSHTGSDSVYFNRYNTYPSLGAYQSPESPYYQWYKFKPSSQEYQSWWGVDALPEVDELNPNYQDFLFDFEDGVIQKWMRKGVAGWRLDVADELPDEFIQKLRQTIKTINPEAVLIGEVWEDATNKQSYGKLREYFWGHELDATMNYPFRSIFLDYMLGKTSSSLVHQQVMNLYENYPRENFYGAMNLIGSHDRERILTLLGEAPDEPTLLESQKQTFRLSSEARELAVRRLKLVTLIQMTFPGVPSVYYGDEAGQEGYSDPYNRATYPWDREDQELLAWYKKMIRLRREYEVLQSGGFHSFFMEPDIYGYRRSGRDEEVLVLINRHATQAREINLQQTLDRQIQNPFVIDLLTGSILGEQIVQTLTIEPLSAKVLFSKPGQLAFPSQDFARSCGVLMHISSLPSDSGAGDMGEEAYRFIDFLVESGQSLWQVLPLNPVGLGDSPYQSDSAFAGNSRLISLECLVGEGLLEADHAEALSLVALSSEMFKEACLRKAFNVFKTQIQEQDHALIQEYNPEQDQNPSLGRIGAESNYLSQQNYLSFQESNLAWLNDYTLFRAIKVHLGEAAWYDWEPELAWRNTDKLAEYSRQLEEEVEFNRFVQYTFYHQWQELRRYASAKGIKLIGDIPIFVAADSCDVWVNTRLFKLDQGGKPAKVAGVPPDYFCKTGQLWGNPVYDWDVSAAENYEWWKQRIKLTLGQFDFIRLDHFRGFEAYWEIDAKEETAINGRWIKGPGKRFFESLSAEFGELPFIAEDLGIITPEVDVLKRSFGFPGMKVLQFTALEERLFEEDSNLIYYSGTHDNDTLVGWYKTALTDDEKFTHVGDDQRSELVQLKLNIESSVGVSRLDDPKEICRRMIEDLYRSPASWVIISMQDILGLDTDSRMNLPGTIEGNWQWKLKKDLLTTEVKEWLRSVACETKRLPKNSLQ